MRILLTGAFGNLGTALRRLPDPEFVPVGRDEWPRLSDLLDGTIDAVLHAAWDIRTSAASEPVAVVEANLLATARLIEACRDRGIKRIGFISTSGVYGHSTDTVEDAPCSPVSVNGLAKLLAERLLADFSAEAGIECQIYRVFNMFGGTDRFSVLSYLRAAVDGGAQFSLNNGGSAERDFIHVDDVARIIGRLIQRDLPVVHVNVGTGRLTRVADIVAIVRDRHPELQVHDRSIREAPSSRADTSRLTSLIGEQEFADILDFVRSEFA